MAYILRYVFLEFDRVNPNTALPPVEAGEPARLGHPEPAFRRLRAAALLPEPADDSFLSFVTRHIAANPADLLSHAKRIMLARHLGNGEGTFGALVDLFIATGSKGLALRRRLVEQCRDILNDRQLGYLQLYLPTGIPAEAVLGAGDSVLLKGYRSGSGRTPDATQDRGQDRT